MNSGTEISASHLELPTLSKGGLNIEEYLPPTDTFFNKDDMETDDDVLEFYESTYCINKSNGKMTFDECSEMMTSVMDVRKLIEVDADGLKTLLETFESHKTMIYTMKMTIMEEIKVKESKRTKIDETDYDAMRDDTTKRINKIFEMIHHTTVAARALIKMRECADINYNPTINDDWGVSRFMPCDDGALNPIQQLITAMTYKFWERNYKRYRETCYEPIKTEEGYNTNAYKCVGKIEDIMYEMCSDQYGQHNLWKCITTNNAGKGALKHLIKCKDPRFPDLVKNRYAFSFKNGVYIVYNKDDLEKSDKFYKYNTREFTENVGSTVCCKYFDQEFPVDMYNTPVETWDSIPTPHFKRILDYQKISKEVQDAIIKYFIGRILYDVGELDDSQVSLFILGRAGSGKSTIVNKMVGEFYDSDDVGVLSSNIEGKFGLGAIYDTFIVIAPEVKRDCTLPQTEFQGMITGENLQLAVKNQPSVKVKWTAGLISAGNQLYGYSDNSGSISRRLPIVEFDEMVKEGDANLGKNLMNEIPMMLLKANRAYLQYVKEARRTGVNDIWTYLPGYFKEKKEVVSAKTQGCLHFIINKLRVTGSKTEDRIKQDDFVQALNTHMRDYNFPKQPFDKDLFHAPFTAHGLSIEVDRERQSQVMYVYGCEFAEDAKGDMSSPNSDDKTDDTTDRNDMNSELHV